MFCNETNIYRQLKKASNLAYAETHFQHVLAAKRKLKLEEARTRLGVSPRGEHPFNIFKNREDSE